MKNEARISVRLAPHEGSHQVTWEIGSDPASAVAFSFEKSQQTEEVLRKLELGTCETDDLRYIGALLWDAMAPLSIATRVRGVVASASAPVELHLDVPEVLARLPWETLYDPGELHYLACHPKLSLVHVVGDEARAEPPRDSISILVVIPEGAGLAVETEWSNLKAAVAKAGGSTELVSLRGSVHPDRLGEELQRKPWSVVHFVGHGRVDENCVEVRLNDESGQEIWCGADAFSGLFQGASVDVCVLNCCQGGAASGVRSMDRLAPGLLGVGVRGVVAMRYALADSDGVRFSQTFYQQLLRGPHPGRPAYAAQLARRSLLGVPSRDERRGFVTPVVHTRGPDQLFFAVQTMTSAPSPSGARIKRDIAPPSLREAVATRRCIPIVGMELVPYPRTRQASSQPNLRGLVEQLLVGLGEPPAAEPTEDAEPARGVSVPVDLLLRRLAERYEASGRWQRMAAIIREFYAPHPPTELHRLVASWRAPGTFYTPFDGLMEASLPAIGRVTSDLTQPVDPVESLLVLVRGTINDHRSLVLSENDHFELGERIERMHQTLCSVARGHLGRCVLFVGQSPGDLVARQLARRLLEPGPRGPEAFFVCSEASSDDEWFWKRFNVSFIRATNDDLIRALTPERGPE